MTRIRRAANPPRADLLRFTLEFQDLLRERAAINTRISRVKSRIDGLQRALKRLEG